MTHSDPPASMAPAPPSERPSGAGVSSRLPPANATCPRHPDRLTLALCPMCQRGACVACWHPSIDRCEGCLRRQPETAASPLPWEAVPRPWWGQRFFGTLATAFRPARSAAAFIGADVGAAWRFALLTALPLALLRGVIPWTQTLRFGPSFHVAVLGDPSGIDIALDLLRATAVSALLMLVYFGSVGLPFLSLCKAYGLAGSDIAARRFLLYRLWLLGLSMRGLLLQIGIWAAPAPAGPLVLALISLLDLVPLLLLASGMRATARIACGLGPWPAVAAVLVPLALLLVTEGIVVALLLQTLGIPIDPPLSTAAELGPMQRS